jgi:UDP-glucose 4-epimerase
MSRRVLVTGGAGFVGSHLVEQLVEAGDRVVVFDNLTRGRHGWLPPAAELHELDIRDSTALDRAVRQTAPEIVVHLAAMHFIPAVEEAPKVARDVNVTGTRALLEALAPLPPKTLLFASTAAVYPDRPGPIDESCHPGPMDLYGRTKLEGERLVKQFAEQTGTRSVTARIFNVIGPRETNPHVVPELVEQLREGGTSVRLGSLDRRRDYTDVRDVATALHRLLRAPPNPTAIFNLGSGRSVSVAELVDTCKELLGRPIEVTVEQRRVRAHDRAELVADAHLLRETTGWKPVRSLRDTFATLLEEPAC